MLELIQPLGYPDYAFFRQASGVTISFGEGRVLKEYPTGSSSIVAKVKRLYNAMAAHGVPNVIRMVKSSGNAVLLEPTGEQRVQPTTIKEIVVAVRDVLKALVALHKIKIMHRDIRWGNVLKHVGRDEWFLIDSEDGAFAPQSHGASRLHHDTHAPEIDSAHTVAVDIWSVGHLLDTTKLWDLPHELREIRDQCLVEAPTARPTAATLLKLMETMARESDK